MPSSRADPADAGPEVAAASPDSTGSVQPGTGSSSPPPHSAGAPPDGATDEVDRIVCDWRRERPDLDVAPLQVLSRVTRLARHLDRARRRAFAAHDLEPWAFDVLTTLRRTGPPYELSPGRLLAATLVTSGTMTNRVDRLVARGLVRRRRATGDRRGVLVGLTPRGAAAVDAALADLLDRERQLLAALPEPQRDQLAELLRSLTRRFDAAE